jgi:hypothetical protein
MFFFSQFYLINLINERCELWYDVKDHTKNHLTQ